MKHLPTVISVGAIIVAIFALTRTNTAPTSSTAATVQEAGNKIQLRANSQPELVELRAQNKVLTEKLQKLKNTLDLLDKRMGDRASARPLPNPAEIEAPPAKDHNPAIPGIQTSDEAAGEPVEGDPANTIHPDTPPELVAADKELKAESIRLTAQSEAAAARGDDTPAEDDKTN